jgi:hypothetical protein
MVVCGRAMRLSMTDSVVHNARKLGLQLWSCGDAFLDVSWHLPV